jgi:sugar diacid utilization regulator
MLVTKRAAEQATPQSLLAGVISGVGVLLAPLRHDLELTPARALAEKVSSLASRIAPDLEVVAAIGGPTELENASRSFAEAKRAIQMLQAIPELGPVVAWEDLGVYRFLALLPLPEANTVAQDPRVSDLLSNDQLAETAQVFLDTACNVQETAAMLYLHRATLYHRLDRIAEVYSLDLRHSGDDRLITHLGLKFARVAHVAHDQASDGQGQATD